MTIPFVSTYLRQRAAGVANSAVVRALEREAAEAAARGDETAAAALQREADRLRQRMLAGNLTFASKQKKEDKEKPLDVKTLAVQWVGLGAGAVHGGPSACMLDCGPRGAVLISGTAVSLTGALQDDPVAILLLARHARLHWEGRVVARGSPEFEFKYGVAAKMLGVKVRRGLIPWGRRTEAAELARDWQPILQGIIEGRTPTRPTGAGPAVVPVAVAP